jgi:PAS domain S-box-containing protein
MVQFLLESISDAVWLIDPDSGTVVDCNDATVALLRCTSRADLIGKRFEDLTAPEQKIGAPTMDPGRPIAERFKSRGSRFSWKARQFDGTEIILEVSAAAIESDGKPIIVLVSRLPGKRKDVESALEDSEERFRSFFERNADAMALLDPETLRFIEVNDAGARLLGAAGPKILCDLSLTGWWPERQPDGRLSVEKGREMVRLALTNGSHRFECMARRYDGTPLTLDIVMTAVPFGARTVLSIVSRDISRHKSVEDEIRRLNNSLEKRVTERTLNLLQANDHLRRTEEKLRKRTEQVQKHRDALLELAQSDKSDLQRVLQNVCSLSAATLDVARVSYWSVKDKDEAICCEVLYRHNTKSFDWFSKGNLLRFAEYPAYFGELAAKRPIVANRVMTHPATSALAETHLASLGVSSLLDAPVLECSDGVGVLRHEHVGPPRDWSAEEVDFVSALTSIISLALEESNRAQAQHLLLESERRLRESEARFGTAFRASPALMTISRLSDQKHVEVNDAFVRWYGLNRDEIIGRDTKELDTWLNCEDRENFWTTLKHNGAVREFECQARTQRGAIGTLLVSADIIEINREPHVIATGLDITQRKQAEIELVRTLAREKELGRLRSHFVSMVSHEFRTPLGIIQSSAEILEDYLDQLNPGERKEHLQSIRQNTSRMASLMEEALLIGGLDAGKIEFKPAPLDLQSFVERLVDEVLSVTNRRCPIELALAEAPGEIQADERLLQHIFTNLLTNGVKYSDPGRAVRLEITCVGKEIICAIRDEGIGIPEGDREWLFSAFHRGQNVVDRPGTGLGLVIVKRCVELHGGKIKVESQFGKGTVVTVRLPLFRPCSSMADQSRVNGKQ